MSEINRDTLWTSYDETERPLKDLETSHLNNLLYHFIYMAGDNPMTGWIPKIFDVIVIILEKERNVVVDLDNLQQIPWKNNEGQTCMWDYATGKAVVIHESNITDILMA